MYVSTQESKQFLRKILIIYSKFGVVILDELMEPRLEIRPPSIKPEISCALVETGSANSMVSESNLSADSQALPVMSTTHALVASDDVSFEYPSSYTADGSFVITYDLYVSTHDIQTHSTPAAVPGTHTSALIHDAPLLISSSSVVFDAPETELVSTVRLQMSTIHVLSADTQISMTSLMMPEDLVFSPSPAGTPPESVGAARTYTPLIEELSISSVCSTSSMTSLADPRFESSSVDEMSASHPSRMWSTSVSQFSTAGITPIEGASSSSIYDWKTVQTKLDSLINELKIDTKSISSYKRKLTSADDSRHSVKIIGWVGTLTLSVALAVIIMLDLHAIIRDLKMLKTNVQTWFRGYSVRDDVS